MPNAWDENYSLWLAARSGYLAMLPRPENEDRNEQFSAVEERYVRTSKNFFDQIEKVLMRAARNTMGSFPLLATQMEAGDLAAEFKIGLQKNPPGWLTEAYIRSSLRHRALSLVTDIRKGPTDPGDPDPDGDAPPAEKLDWPWFEVLPEPARGYGALFSHILRLDDNSQADSFSKTGWFSGRSGESVRAKLRNEAEWREERTLRKSQKISELDLRLLNAEMLGAHSALTVSIRALCDGEKTPPAPFPAETVDQMSQMIERAPDAAVARWVIDSLAGKSPRVPEKLAECAQHVLQGDADAANIRYFIGCVSLYLQAYSVLIIPAMHHKEERHWTELSAPMTPRAAEFPQYRARAKNYKCLENICQSSGR